MLKHTAILAAGALALALPTALAQTAPAPTPPAAGAPDNSKLPEGAADILATLPAPTEMISIWTTGPFTQEQAMRGQVIYSGNCAKCHGRNANGAGDPDQPDSPAIARAPFLTKWDGQNVGLLYEYVHQWMPIDNPMSLEPQMYADALAYVLSLSTVPPGQ